MLSVKAIYPVSVNAPTPMPTTNVTSAAPVEMDYWRSKRRGVVPAGLPRVVVTPMQTVYSTTAMAGDRAA